MIAAIYARKSTEQTGTADDQKSVARQIENARAFAAAKGWQVDERHVYADDAVGGAETTKLVNRQRLLRIMGDGAPFQVLILRDASRFSRRDGDEAFGELKRIAQSGVEIWFYQDGSRFEYGNFAANITGIVRAEMNAEYRHQVARWTAEAMERKARAGHVTGGRVFGYDNVDVVGPTGVRSHVVLRVNEAEAAIVLRIFQRAALGDGLKTIAKALNDDGAISPRSQQGRPRSWAPTSVREVLRRELYHGQRVWNKTKKRDATGQQRVQDRPAHEWLTVDVPELRIVPEALWLDVQARIAAKADSHRNWCRAGKPAGQLTDGRGVRAKYLLTGFSRCSHCGGSMQAVSRSSTKGRSFRYVCATYWNRGASACANGRSASMKAADAAVAGVLAEVLRPDWIERALDLAVAMLTAERDTPTRESIARQLGDVERELANLAEAAARGGAVPVVLEALTRRDGERQRLRHALAEASGDNGRALRPEVLRAQLRAFLGDWTALVRDNVAEARNLLGIALGGRIGFERAPEGGYTVRIPIAFDRVMTAAVPELRALQDSLASQPAATWNQIARFVESFRELRQILGEAA